VQLAGRALPSSGPEATPAQPVCNAPGALRHPAGTAGPRVRRQRPRANIAFLLRHEPPPCVVDPRGAKVFPAAKSRPGMATRNGTLVRLPERQGFYRQVIDALACPKAVYRYTEYRLVPARAHLRARRHSASPAAQALAIWKTPPRRFLHDWKKDQNTLLGRFDRDRDGILSARGMGRGAASPRGRRRRSRRMTQPPGVPRISA